MDENTQVMFDTLRRGLRQLPGRLQSRARILRGAAVIPPNAPLTRTDLAQTLEEMAREFAMLYHEIDEQLQANVPSTQGDRWFARSGGERRP